MVKNLYSVIINLPWQNKLNFNIEHSTKTNILYFSFTSFASSF